MPTQVYGDQAQETRRWYAKNWTPKGQDEDLLKPILHINEPSSHKKVSDTCAILVPRSSVRRPISLGSSQGVASGGSMLPPQPGQAPRKISSGLSLLAAPGASRAPLNWGNTPTHTSEEGSQVAQHAQGLQPQAEALAAPAAEVSVASLSLPGVGDPSRPPRGRGSSPPRAPRVRQPPVLCRKMLSPCLRVEDQSPASSPCSQQLAVTCTRPGDLHLQASLEPTPSTGAGERSAGGDADLTIDTNKLGCLGAPLRGSMPVCLALCRQIRAHPPCMAGASSLQPADHCRRRWVAACSSLLARCQHTQGGEPRCGPQQSRLAR